MSGVSDQITNFLRALKADLVEKRLVPVVALLVAAAVGIPVAFAVTSSKAPNVSTTPTVVAATGPGAALTAAPPRQAPSGSLGTLHDPFAGHGAAATGTTGPSAAASPITARTGPTGPGGAVSKPVSAAPAPATGTSGPSGPSAGAPKPQPSWLQQRELRVYKVNYSFGEGANIKVYDDALRLDAVPSNSAPVAQLLGVTKDTRKAVFLIWGAASVSGDGVCIVGSAPCEIVELKPSQTEFIDVLVPGAGIVQFELDMLAIDTSEASSQAAALKAHMRQSSDGIKLLSLSKAAALAKFEYSTVFGTLLPRPGQPGSSNQANSTSANSVSEARPSRWLGRHRVHRARHGR